MPENRRALLARRHHASIAEALFRYITDGGPVRLSTDHGADAEENSLTFSILDWDAFVHALEPEVEHG